MPRIQGFPPIGPADARVLVLGSMPSRESLRQQQYYAHPRNAFWPIMGRLFECPVTRWQEKLQLIERHRIAVWDVLQACFRSSSLDSDIEDSSIVTNDFCVYFEGHPFIRHVYFNGAKAESVYRRHVTAELPHPARFPYTRLPSTSPAHASLDLDQKTSAWRVILDELK